MSELVDDRVLKTLAFGRAGSSPAGGTTLIWSLKMYDLLIDLRRRCFGIHSTYWAKINLNTNYKPELIRLHPPEFRLVFEKLYEELKNER